MTNSWEDDKFIIQRGWETFINGSQQIYDDS